MVVAININTYNAWSQIDDTNYVNWDSVMKCYNNFCYSIQLHLAPRKFVLKIIYIFNIIILLVLIYLCSVHLYTSCMKVGAIFVQLILCGKGLKSLNSNFQKTCLVNLLGVTYLIRRNKLFGIICFQELWDR